MLDNLKIEELLENVGSRYELVIAGAKRARQINEYTATLGLNESLGIPGPQVHTRSQHPLSIAIEELRAEKMRLGYRTEAARGGEAGTFTEDLDEAGGGEDGGEEDQGAA